MTVEIICCTFIDDVLLITKLRHSILGYDTLISLESAGSGDGWLGRIGMNHLYIYLTQPSTMEHLHPTPLNTTSAGPPITSPDPTSPSSNHSTPSPTLPKLKTAHGHFLLPPSSPSLPSPSALLRGVNLSSSSKFPPFPPSTPDPTGTREQRDRARLEDSGWRTDIPAQNGWWEEAEKGGRDGWFVGRPLKEDEADVSWLEIE